MNTESFRQLNKTGNRNGNWKGGISSVRSADAVLSLPVEGRKEIIRRLRERSRENPQTGCWDWVGSVFSCNGRPLLNLGDNISVARLILVLRRKKPLGKLCALHHCDNPACVNPNHLYAGTNADNSNDMVRRGRSATGDRNGSRLYPERLARGDDNWARRHPETRQGERNGRATLTNEQVREIRRRYKPYKNCRNPSNQRELAEEFGVSQSIIRLICKGFTWRSVLD